MYSDVLIKSTLFHWQVLQSIMIPQQCPQIPQMWLKKAQYRQPSEKRIGLLYSLYSAGAAVMPFFECSTLVL